MAYFGSASCSTNFRNFISILALFSSLLVGCEAVKLHQLTENGFENFEQEFYWGLTDVNKTRTCILLTGLFEIIIPYDTYYGSNARAVITLPKTASVDGICDSPTNKNMQIMSLSWNPKNHKQNGQEADLTHNLTFTFIRKRYSEDGDSLTDPYYELTTIQANIQANDEDFPDATDSDKVYELTASHLEIMSAPDSLSYFCKSTQVIEFDDEESTIGMTFVHAQAFHEEVALGDGHDFGPKSFCAKDGFEVILMVLTYVVILALIGLGIFYIMDRKSKRSYIYL